MTEMHTDVAIIGAQKAATSSLFDQLSMTPGIIGARPKEPQFFAQTPDWRSNLESYHEIYPEGDGLRLEASTTYTFAPYRNPAIWEDMHAYNPAMRLIYVVRDPIDRIRSHYKHSFKRGYTTRNITGFIKKGPLSLAISRYYSQVMPFIRTFGTDQVLLLRFEDVASGVAVPQVARFLDLDPASVPEIPHSNKEGTMRVKRRLPLAERVKRRLKPSTVEPDATMSPRLQMAILESLEPDIEGLERLTGWDLSAWRRHRPY